MATEPGTTEIITTTLRRRRGVLVNDIENHNPIMRSMKEYDAIELEPGGRTLLDEVFFDENDTVGHYSNFQPINTAYNPVATAFEVEWKQFAGAVVISGREERMNSGAEGKIKLFKTRIQALEFSLKNFMDQDLYSDGTGSGGLQIGGLKYWVPTAETTGTKGGIDVSTSAGTFARNFAFDTVSDNSGGAPGGAATTAATMKPYLNWCINSTTRGNDRVKVMLMGQQHYEFMQSSQQSIQRIVDEVRIGRSGYKGGLEHEGIECVMAGGISFGGQTTIATDRTYGLNTRFTKLRIHKDAYFEPLPEMQSINQDAKVKIVVFMGNMTSSFPRGNFVMFDS